MTSLIKEKRIILRNTESMNLYQQEGLQLRSSTFQLLKLAFDEEVTSENIEIFRKYLLKSQSSPDSSQSYKFEENLFTNPKSMGSKRGDTIR